MRRILIPMCVNSWQIKLALILGGLSLVAPIQAAVPETIHDSHRLTSSDDFQRTIEARCTICHTRQRVDTAVTQQEELEALLQRMIERGAILNDGDKKMLGTFWGSPLKGDQAPEVKPFGR